MREGSTGLASGQGGRQEHPAQVGNGEARSSAGPLKAVVVLSVAGDIPVLLCACWATLGAMFHKYPFSRATNSVTCPAHTSFWGLYFDGNTKTTGGKEPISGWAHGRTCNGVLASAGATGLHFWCQDPVCLACEYSKNRGRDTQTCIFTGQSRARMSG